MIRSAVNLAGQMFWSTADALWPAPPPAPGRADALKSHPIDISSSSDSDDDVARPWYQCLPRPTVRIPPRPAPDAPDGLRMKFVLSRDIAAPMPAIARTICDSDRGHTWIDRCVESRLLTATTTGPIAYHRYRLPFVGDRDSVTRTTLEAIDADTMKISVQPWDTPEVRLPPNTVRLPWVRGNFRLTALGPDITRVCHTSELVLGGSIPGMLGPMIRRKKPKKTLEQLAALVETADGGGD